MTLKTLVQAHCDYCGKNDIVTEISNISLLGQTILRLGWKCATTGPNDDILIRFCPDCVKNGEYDKK